MNYSEFKEKREQMFSDFPIFFAFSDKQLEEGLVKLNTTIKEICSVGCGGYLKKTDIKAFENMMEQHEQELKELLTDDSFLYDALEYELNNHEDSYTYNYQPAFDALDLAYDDERALKAMRQIRSQYDN